MSYREASDETIRLIDQGLEIGSKSYGSLNLEKPEIHDAPCGETDVVEAYPTYEYHFALELLGPNPNAFARRVADFWKSEGFKIIPDDIDPEIYGSFAESDDFNLQVFVNQRTGMALVAGSGPCVPKPEANAAPDQKGPSS